MTSPILRTAFSDSKLKKICEWVQDEGQISGTQPQGQVVQKWFADTHNSKVILQSTINKILKCFDEFLDRDLVHSYRKKR